MVYRWCVIWNSVLLVLFSNFFLIAFILPLDIISSLPLNLGILHFNCIANPCFEIHFHKRSSIITTSEVSVYFLVELLSSQILGIVPLHFSYLLEYYISIFNNISVLSWWSALSVEETRVPRENHSTATLWWSALSVEETTVLRENYSNCHKSYTNFITRDCIKYTSSWARIKLTTVNETITLLWSHHLLLWFFLHGAVIVWELDLQLPV